MSGRDEVIAEFLAAHGCKDAPPVLLAGDASFRTYYRTTKGQIPVVLMDAPPPEEDVRPFMAIANHLLAEGFSAPRILGANKSAGLLLLEDLGDDKYNDIIAATPGEEEGFYEAAIDLLVTLQSGEAPDESAVDAQETHLLPAYDVERLLEEAALFTDWYLPAVTGRQQADWREELGELLRPLLQPVCADEQVLVLRDYHADNLMWLAERQGTSRVGLLDFQDAVIGHPAYDMVSLLRDARRDVPESLEAAMIDRYLNAMSETNMEIDETAYRRAYALLGVQRNAKIIGIFTRLWKRDGKPSYLAMIPRVWGLLERSLQHEDFADLRAFFDARLSPELRAVTPTIEAMPR